MPSPKDAAIQNKATERQIEATIEDRVARILTDFREKQCDGKQSLACKLTGLAQPVYSMYEHKERFPSADAVVMIARALRVSVDYVVGEPLMQGQELLLALLDPASPAMRRAIYEHLRREFDPTVTNEPDDLSDAEEATRPKVPPTPPHGPSRPALPPSSRPPSGSHRTAKRDKKNRDKG